MRTIQNELFEVEVVWDADRAIPFLPNAGMVSRRPGRHVQLMTRSQLESLELLQDRHPHLRIKIHDVPLLVVARMDE